MESRKPDARRRSLDRRDFLQLASATVASVGLSGSLLGQTPVATGTFHFTKAGPYTVPQDFNGLSYESPQLNNPDFFSAANAPLIKMFQELAPTGGVLRIGGNLCEYTDWRDENSGPRTPEVQKQIDHAKNYFEWILVDQKAAKGRDAVITPKAIENLAGFLHATGWKLLYSLNFGTGTIERAVVEAACVQRFCGDHLVAFQFGNEVDFYKGGKRSQDWDFDHYYAEYVAWSKAILAKVPDARFAGPDIAVRMDWVKDLAEKTGKHAVLLTGHHYAMGPAGAPGIDAAKLLARDPAVPGILEAAQQATAMAGIPFRMAEGNSCFHGGAPGVSNGYASALWGADYMLLCAAGGHAGMCLHGGGEGIYSPIVGDQEIGFTARPLYFGMQLAQRFVGATMLEGKLSVGKANLTAYAGRRGEELVVALINKSPEPAAITLTKASLGKSQPRELWRLSAPSLDSRANVSFEKVKLDRTGLRSEDGDRYQLEPYTALFLRYS